MNTMYISGSKWGLTDLYPDSEKELIRAIENGADFKVSWSSKKEIASACIDLYDGIYTIDVHVSDDFDTDGHCRDAYFPKSDSPSDVYKKLMSMIDQCWDDAIYNQKQNRTVAMYAIRKDGKWIETYIENLYVEEFQDVPPGGFYQEFGFQGDSDLPSAIKNKIHLRINTERDKSFTVGDYSIELIDD